jgi:hypothetical protein
LLTAHAPLDKLSRWLSELNGKICDVDCGKTCNLFKSSKITTDSFMVESKPRHSTSVPSIGISIQQQVAYNHKSTTTTATQSQTTTTSGLNGAISTESELFVPTLLTRLHDGESFLCIAIGSSPDVHLYAMPQEKHCLNGAISTESEFKRETSENRDATRTSKSNQSSMHESQTNSSENKHIVGNIEDAIPILGTEVECLGLLSTLILFSTTEEWFVPTLLTRLHDGERFL